MTDPHPDLVYDVAGLLDHAVRLMTGHDLHTAHGREATEGERAILLLSTRYALDRWGHRTLIETLLNTSSGDNGNLATGEAVTATGSALLLVRSLYLASPLDQFLTVAAPRAHSIGLPPPVREGADHALALSLVWFTAFLSPYPTHAARQARTHRTHRGDDA